MPPFSFWQFLDRRRRQVPPIRAGLRSTEVVQMVAVAFDLDPSMVWPIASQRISR
jgi:hypothetical protein